MKIEINIEKKHAMAIVLAIVLVSATNFVFAPTAGQQYHPVSELYVDGNLSLNGYNLTDVKTIVFADGKTISSTSGGVPSGAILMFNTTCPSGWTRFAALDGRVTKGAVAYGVTGGADTHTHPYGTRYATCSGGTCHYYSATSVSSTPDNSWPPYLEVIWCQKD